MKLPDLQVFILWVIIYFQNTTNQNITTILNILMMILCIMDNMD